MIHSSGSWLCTLLEGELYQAQKRSATRNRSGYQELILINCHNRWKSFSSKSSPIGRKNEIESALKWIIGLFVGDFRKSISCKSVAKRRRAEWWRSNFIKLKSQPRTSRKGLFWFRNFLLAFVFRNSLDVRRTNRSSVRKEIPLHQVGARVGAFSVVVGVVMTPRILATRCIIARCEARISTVALKSLRAEI